MKIPDSIGYAWCQRCASQVLVFLWRTGRHEDWCCLRCGRKGYRVIAKGVVR